MSGPWEETNDKCNVVTIRNLFTLHPEPHIVRTKYNFLEYQKKQVWVVTTIIKLIWEVQKSSFSPKEIVCVVAHRVFLLVI